MSRLRILNSTPPYADENFRVRRDNRRSEPVRKQSSPEGICNHLQYYSEVSDRLVRDAHALPDLVLSNPVYLLAWATSARN